MAKTKISEFSTTPGNNTDINGINIAEGCAPSGINNAIRELMSDLKEWQSGAMDVYVIPQGTAAAPGIQLYGDLDTGLYGFAANQLGVAVGGASAGYFSSAGWVGNVNGTITGDINATTIDTTNLEVTNIKAKDGTAAITIADSTGVVSVSTQLAVDNLNLSGNTLSSSDTNGNIVLAPNGTGDVHVDADTLRVGDSNANAIITTNGTGDLTLNTNGGTNSGAITIEDGVNGNINVVPNGTGGVYLDNTAGTSLFVRNTTSSASGSSFVAFQNKDGAGNYRTVARASGLTTSNGGNGSFVVETAFSNVLYKGLLINSESDVFFYDSNGNQALKWDSSDKYLGINQTSPTAALDVVGDVKVSGTVNAATIDLTNIEVSNIKAKDGTAAITIADSTGAVGISTAVTMSATTQNIALGTSQTTGTFTVGGASQTGTQTFDQSTKTHTLNLGTGATESGLTKTINIGTAGVSGSTTAITIGSANGTTTTLNGTVTAATLNSTTIDTTNLEVTNIKAKDGTAALSIADSTGAVTVATALTANGGAVFNENGADVDFRVEGDTDANLIFADASTDRVGIGTNSPGNKLTVKPSATSSGTFDVLTGSTNTDSIRLSGGGTVNTWLELRGYLGVKLYSDSTNTVTVDSSGNLGLGVAPSAWNTFRAAQVGAGAAVFGHQSTVSEAYLSANLYYNSGVKYIGSGQATYYGQSSGTHAWYTAPSGTAGNAITFTQAMTLDASGRLLVKATSNTGANTKLAVGAGLTSGNAVAYISTEDVDVDGVQISNWTGSATTNRVSLAFDSSGIGAFRIGIPGGVNAFQIYDTVAATERARITSGGDFRVKGAGTAGSTDAFQISGSAPADAARLTSDGDLLVGTTSSGTAVTSGRMRLVGNTGGLNVYYAEQSVSGGYCLVSNTVSNGGTYYHVVFLETGTERGSITSNGSATAYNTSSDYRLKDNPQPLTNSGAFIDALQPKTWNWKETGKKGVGFIAHEVQTVSPGSVVGEKDAVDADGNPIMQAMEYGSAEFIANIIAELQSLRVRVAQLEGK